MSMFFCIFVIYRSPLNCPLVYLFPWGKVTEPASLGYIFTIKLTAFAFRLSGIIGFYFYCEECNPCRAIDLVKNQSVIWKLHCELNAIFQRTFQLGKPICMEIWFLFLSFNQKRHSWLFYCSPMAKLIRYQGNYSLQTRGRGSGIWVIWQKIFTFLDILRFDHEAEFWMLKQNAGLSYFMDLFIEFDEQNRRA